MGLLMNNTEDNNLLALNRLGFIAKLLFKGVDYPISLFLIGYAIAVSFFSFLIGLYFLNIDILSLVSSDLTKASESIFANLDAIFKSYFRKANLPNWLSIYWVLKSGIVSIFIPVLTYIIIISIHPGRKNIIPIQKIPLFYAINLSVFILVAIFFSIISGILIDNYIFSMSENNLISSIFISSLISSYLFYNLLLKESYNIKFAHKLGFIFIVILVTLFVGFLIMAGLEIRFGTELEKKFILGISNLLISVYFLGLFIAGIILIFSERSYDVGKPFDAVQKALDLSFIYFFHDISVKTIRVLFAFFTLFILLMIGHNLIRSITIILLHNLTT